MLLILLSSAFLLPALCLELTLRIDFMDRLVGDNVCMAYGGVMRNLLSGGNHTQARKAQKYCLLFLRPHLLFVFHSTIAITPSSYCSRECAQR